MKVIKTLLILAVIYVGIVVAFESLLGYFQPEQNNTLVLVTHDADGTRHERVVTELAAENAMYIGVNHWPRAWFRRLLENPHVEVFQNATTTAYTAVHVTDPTEYDRINTQFALPFTVRFLTGFPPRELIRLDPRNT